MTFPSHVRKLCLLGGTGSLGQAVIDRSLGLGLDEVLAVSRDEQKLVTLSRKYVDYPQVHFRLGDVRNRNDVECAITDSDAVVYMAAVKHVSVCEDHPEEAVKTNILGAVNVLDVVRSLSPPRQPTQIVAISTDKAVDPVNVYGMSKALQERMWTAYARRYPAPSVSVVRYGNVLGSNGSIVPVIESLFRARQPLTVTDPEMTRFLFTLEGAVDLIFHALSAPHGSLLVPKLSSCTVADIVKYVVGDEYPVKIVGIRPGEKWHESLISGYERVRCTEVGPESVGGAVFSLEQAQGPGKPFSSADHVLGKHEVFAYLRAAGVKQLTEL